MNITEEMNDPLLPTKIDTSISLHPNPATDFIQVCGVEGTVIVTISDIYCRVLCVNKVVCNENIPVSFLRKGVYIAKITTASGTVEKKLIKE